MTEEMFKGADFVQIKKADFESMVRTKLDGYQAWTEEYLQPKGDSK